MKQQRSIKQLPMKQQLSPSSKTKKVDEEHRLIRLCKELYKDDKSSFISVTELLRLTNVGIPSADVTWSRTKMSMEHCICVRHTCVRTRPAYNPQHTHRSEPTDAQSNGRAKFFLNDEELNLSSSYDSNKKDSYDKYSNGRNSLSSEDSKCSQSKFKKNSFNSKLKLTNEKASFLLGNNLSVYKSDINLDNHLSPNLFGKQGRRQLTKSNSFNNIINSYQNGTYRSNAETMNHYPNNEHSIGHNSLDLPDIRLRQQHYFTSVLSLINPYDARISKFEVDYVKIAELNPIRTFIAVATNYTVHTISIGLCKVIATCHLPEMVDHICWLTPLIVAIVTSRTVYHWNLKNNTNQPVVVFFKSPKMYNCQIIGYEADDTMAWFAVSSLYLEEDQRTITGLVQIHHMNEKAKLNSGNEVDANNNNCFQQCIEAHCVRFARIRFDENNLESTTLIALKKTSSNTMKIYIIELGPLKAQNNCLVNRTEQLRFNDSVNGQSIDFPLHCVICFKLGLIYVISKYGQLIICDLQTGVQLNEQQTISEDVILSAKLDIDAQSIVLIARNGQVLLVEFDFGSLIKRFARDVKLKKIAKRIERALDSSNDEVTRL